VHSSGLAAAPEGVTPTVALLENLPDAIVLVNESGEIAYANAAAERLFGKPAARLAGTAFASLLADPFEEQYAQIASHFGLGEEILELGERREVVARGKGGAGVAIELTINEVRVSETRSMVAVGRDISGRKLEETALRQMANQDTLTGLSNRTSFELALAHHVEYASRYGTGGSVVALGVDNFRYVNEALGVAAGDEILLGLTEMLSGRLRNTDLLARVNGDVFAVLAPGTDKATALKIADELLGNIRRHTFVINGEGMRITMSAGVTSLDSRSVGGNELLAEAENAMNTSKDLGRDRAQGFISGGETVIDQRRAWTERIRQATERGLFVLVSQPIMNLAKGEITQHEILLRMREDGGGLIPPGSFLATAERFGQIGGIDRWVMQQSIRLIAAHNKEGRELTLEVNLSGKTMGDPQFPDEVRRELTRSGIDPASLIFEVTETAAVADIEQARAFAQALARVGCRFALDDFGSGYASFYYLKHLPISYLKIDGEFVKELPRSPVDQRIIGALVQVCNGIGVKTVAEFVEDQQTLDILRDLGVDFAQGYHLGRPAPVSELRTGPQDG
jgi:diguanylate cyclase (GGDEF)-like protein/PAS domain S-box-containing protein